MGLGQTARWNAASDTGKANLEKHGVYELVPIIVVAAGQRVNGTQWVNKIKPDGTFKSRIVVDGWSQVPVFGGGGTFVPVCGRQGIRVMLAIATELDYEEFMLDVRTASLNADVEEDVCVKMAVGHVLADKSGVPLVIILRNSLSGLRQSPNNWFDTMDNHLAKLEFRPLKSDHAFTYSRMTLTLTSLTLYVDDVPPLGANMQLLNMLKKQLMDRSR